MQNRQERHSTSDRIMKQVTILLAFISLLSLGVNAQCSCTSGELEYYADIDGDNYGAGPCICSSVALGTGYVQNNQDLCPADKFHHETVGLCGCGVDDTIDTDGDGLIDCQDPCPYSYFNNSNADGDGDGVPDCSDQCPENGEIWVSSSVCGCLSDQNADGVINEADCPFSANSGCTDILACNFKSAANQDDGTCVYPTNCRECYDAVSAATFMPNTAGALTDGSGMLHQNMEGAPCGCQSGGSPLVEDAVGECGGACTTDLDEDGVCDDKDPCVNQISGVKCDPLTNPDCPRLDQCNICTTPNNSQQFNFYRQKVLYQNAAGAPCVPDWKENGQPCIPGSSANCTNQNVGCDQVVTYADATGASCPGAHVSGCYAVYTACSDPADPQCYWGTTGCRRMIYTDAQGDPCHPGSTGCTGTINPDCLDTSTACKPGSEGCQTSNATCNCTTQMQADGSGGSSANAVPLKVYSFCMECGGDDPQDGFGCDYLCLDTDGDGVCDDDEILGCPNPNNCAYDASFTEANNSLCKEKDICGVCAGTNTFNNSTGTPCVPSSWQTEDGASCTQGDNGCFPVFNDPTCTLASGACDCMGNLPVYGYDCAGGCILDLDGDGTCDPEEIYGCTDINSCNFESTATENDLSCLTNDALGECGGNCYSDIDGDLICDREISGTLIDDCVGSLDDCGICNGYSTYQLNGSPCAPGTFLDSAGEPCIPGTTGCFSCTMQVIIESGALVVPDYRNLAGERCIPGSTDCTDQNTYPTASTTSNACNSSGDTYDAIGNCGGNCSTDADGDGICDVTFDGQIIDEDPDSTCDGTFDKVGVCDGTCILDADNDGLCDQHSDGSAPEDPCIGLSSNYQDECGQCGGTGIPSGKCDCDGLFENDALGQCGGDCVEDWDNDGICDLTAHGDTPDPCVGSLDLCGICNGQSEYLRNGQACIPGTYADINGVPCNGPSDNCFACEVTVYLLGDQVCEPVYTNSLTGQTCHPGEVNCTATYPAGCTAIQSCDCWGHSPDVFGNCDGGCVKDEDGDGICDETSDGQFIDLCVSATGFDAVGVCGGTCQDDIDGDGICDDGGNDTCVGIIDECGDCNGTGKAFARDCDGFCYNPTVDEYGNPNHDLCQELEAIAIAQGWRFVGTGNTNEIGLSDRDVHEAMQQFTQLHAAMVDSLNGGSLNGVTYQAILDRSIESDGFLDVKGIANFRKNVRITGNLLIDQILNVSQNATIGGITYSNNGLRADVVENLGQFSTAGSVRFGSGLEVYGTATFQKQTGLQGNLTLYESPSILGQTNTSPLFQLLPLTGNANLQGRLISSGPLTAQSSAQFEKGLSVSNVAAIGDLRVEEITTGGLTKVLGNVDIQNGNVTIDAANGNVSMNGSLEVEGNMTAYTMKGLTNLDILGTTIARTGVETPSMIARGNLTVGGRSDFTRKLFVDGYGQFENSLSVVGPVNMHGTQPEPPIYTDNDGNVCVPTYTDSDGNPCTTFGQEDADCAEEWPAGCKIARMGNYATPANISITQAGSLGTSGIISSEKEVKLDDTRFSADLSISGSNTISGSASFASGSLTVDQGITFGSSSTTQFNDTVSAPTLTVNSTATGLSVTGHANSSMSLLRLGGNLSLGATKLYSQTNSSGNRALNVSSSGTQFVAEFINQPQSADQSTAANTTEDIGGIKIKLKKGGNTSSPFGSSAKSNNFVAFRVGGNHLIGRIHMQSESDRRSAEYYQVQAKSVGYNEAAAIWGVTNAAITNGLALVELVQATSEVLAFSTHNAPCPGNGYCQTLPLISMAIGAGVNAFNMGINMLNASFGTASAASSTHMAQRDKSWLNYTNFEGVPESEDYYPQFYSQIDHTLKPLITLGSQKYGVAYESGNADFAEWLPKADASIEFKPGMVVGLHEDGISMRTTGALKTFLVSGKPILTGNAPKPSQRHKFTRIALMGQVDALVVGAVEAGDFILPTGSGNGICQAINPSEMNSRMLQEVVGVAWDSNPEETIKKINVAVGVGHRGLEHQFEEIERETKEMNIQADGLKDVLLAMSKGKQPSNASLRKAGLIENRIVLSTPTLDDLVDSEYDLNLDDPNTYLISDEVASDYYAEVNKEVIREQLDIAIKWMRLVEYPGMSEEQLEVLESNEDLREVIVEAIEIVANDLQDVQANHMQSIYGTRVPLDRNSAVKSSPFKNMK